MITIITENWTFFLSYQVIIKPKMLWRLDLFIFRRSEERGERTVVGQLQIASLNPNDLAYPDSGMLWVCYRLRCRKLSKICHNWGFSWL